jgi:hypothetical protein
LGQQTNLVERLRSLHVRPFVLLSKVLLVAHERRNDAVLVNYACLDERVVPLVDQRDRAEEDLGLEGTVVHSEAIVKELVDGVTKLTDRV